MTYNAPIIFLKNTIILLAILVIKLVKMQLYASL